MKLYTGKGDDGTTGLFGGGRVRKDDLRIEACGHVDELNCAIGLARGACGSGEIGPILDSMQSMLFDMGADLATLLSTDAKKVPRMSEDEARTLEQRIDEVCAALAPIENFILPGGCELACRLHQARAVCRRAERACVSLAAAQPVNAHVVIVLNRLSDLLFALARRANQIEGVADVAWRGKA